MKTSPLRRKLLEVLTIKGYSERTMESYVWAVARLAKHYNRRPDEISDEEIRAYLYSMHTETEYAASTINVAINGLRFFYREVLERPLGRIEETLPRPRKSTRRARAYSVEEVRRLFEGGFTSPKHRAVCMSLYGGGLRVGEGCRLKAEHIDAERMLIRVDQGKGRKDRYTLLPVQLLLELRSYWKSHRPEHWMFPSRQDPTRPIGEGSVQKAFKAALERAGLPRKGGPHTLRHSFATHLIETGVPLHVIKRLMGHKSATTTAGYLHISRHTLEQVESPLDGMGLLQPPAF